MSQRLFEVFAGENASGVAYKNKLLKRRIVAYLGVVGNIQPSPT